jgi:hypothetical protein
MTEAEASPVALTVEEALNRLRGCKQPPGKTKGRSWYEIARVLGLAVEGQQKKERQENADKAAIEEEEAARATAEASEERELRRPRCGTSGKVCFPSHQAAKGRMRSIRSGDPLRAYFCKDCGSWHLTSQKGKR